MEYASRAVGNAGLTTGIIGTALGALNGAGGLDLLNFGPRRPRDDGDIPVTRHDMGLYRELAEKDFKIASLESNKYTDQQIRDLSDKLNARMDMQFGGVQQQLNAQAVWNATQQGLIGCIQGQVAQLQSMTQLVIPNKSVMPGWGPVEISAPGGTVATATTGTNG
jgi:hypothetical protein